MSEKLNSSPEHEINSGEVEKAAAERKAELHEALERSAEQTKELDVAAASKEALEAAKSTEKEQSNEKATTAVEKAGGRLKNTKAGKKAAFELEMKEARAHMSAPGRAFSKVIHIPAVEKVSEGVGNTIARPNALLAGSLSALILTSAVYFWARYVGYPLSGFESIGAFIVGWLIGIIFDFTKIMITGKK